MTSVQSPAFRIDADRGPPHGLTLTSAAAARLARLSTEDGRELMLRVAVDGGGCSGFQYRFDLVEAADEEDLRVSAEGRTALVDPVSLPFLTGSQIDFVDDLAGAQFTVRNPNATSSCGCGVSFAV